QQQQADDGVRSALDGVREVVAVRLLALEGGLVPVALALADRQYLLDAVARPDAERRTFVGLLEQPPDLRPAVGALREPADEALLLHLVQHLRAQAPLAVRPAEPHRH